MTMQMPLFEKTDSKVAAGRFAEVVGEAFEIDRLVHNLQTLAEASGGIDALRRLVLQLAVRGKLVAQDQSEGTGRAALESARRCEASLVAQGKLRRRPPYPPVSPAEELFEIPASWPWVRFGELGGWGAGATPARGDARYYGGEMPWFKSGELNDSYITDSQEHVTDLALRECSLRLNQPGDVLIAMYGATIGKVAIAKAACTTNQAVCACTCHDAVDNEFLLRLLKAFRSHFVEQGAGGAQPNISRVKIVETPCPLPPLAEQKRIVAKVDQLMALCDDLEVRQNKKREVGARLTKSALEALTTAEGPEEFDTAWQRVVENFDVLIDRAEKVGALRRAMLEAGVRGWLVRQQDSDESVETLWKRIGGERTAMLEGKRRGGKGQGSAHTDPLPEPHPIPKSWRWCQLGDVAGHIVDGTHHTPKYREKGVAFISAKDIKGGKLVFDKCRYISEEEFMELAGRCCPKPGDVLVTKSGSIGEVAIVDTDRRFTLFESVALIPVVPSVDQRFVAHVAYLGASGQFGKANQKGIGVTHLHLVDLRRLPFPLPPLKEQRRIVAKIDQLMKLCDHLEQHLRRAEDRARKLVDAVVSELVA